MSDRTLLDVLIKELESKFLENLFESLHEMYKDTCVGEIFEKFYFYPAHHYLLNDLEDRLFDVGEYVDESGEDIEIILSEHTGMPYLIDTYYESKEGWEEGTYDKWERRFGEGYDYYYRSVGYLELEEVEDGVFGDLEDVAESIITHLIETEPLDYYLENAINGLLWDRDETYRTFFANNGWTQRDEFIVYLYGSPTWVESREEKYNLDLFRKHWSANIKMQVTLALGIEKTSKIFKPLEDYEFGLLDDTVPLEIRVDVAGALVRAIATAEPEWVYANSLSRMYSATSYKWFKEDFFPTLSRSQIKQSPLNPLYLLMRVEDIDEAKELSEMGCRVAVTSRFANEHNLSEASFIDLIYVDGSTKSVKSNVDLVSICNSFQSVSSYYVVESCMPPELIWDGATLPNISVEIVAPGKNWTIFTGVEPFDVQLSSRSSLESVTFKLGFGPHSTDLAEIVSPPLSDEFEINLQIPNEILIKEDIGRSDFTYWEFLDACSPTIRLFQTLYLEKYIEEGGSLQLTEEKTLDLLDKSYPNKVVWRGAYYDLAFREPSISAVLEVLPSKVFCAISVSGPIQDLRAPYAPYVVKPLGNVKIVYYTDTSEIDGTTLPSQKVSSRLRYSQANYSLENRATARWFDSFARQGNLEALKRETGQFDYGFPSILPYIGYKNAKKMYKNSNFIAYSYIYIFLPQILGRFGEHVAEDVVSQTLPLGSVISLYFKEIEDKDILSSIAQNPREFLDLAKRYTELGVNPMIPKKNHPIYDDFPENFFAGDYLTALRKEWLAPYNCVLRFMYSFIDTYTKPLSILYNALQFAPSSSSRANPVLRSEKKNLTNNYSLNYSDGSWVDEYMKSIKESQTGEGFGDLIQSQSIPSEEAIQQEIEYFTRHAEVKEYAEISKIVRVLKEGTYREIRNAGIKFPAQKGWQFDSAFRNMYSLINTGPLSKVLDSAEMKGHRTVYDAEGEFFSGVFNTQLTASITFIGKLASFVVGTFVGADKDSRFYKLFLTGSKSPSAPVKNTADFREFLEYPLITKKITRILQNPEVSVGDKKLPFTVANLSKNLVPLDFMRYMISEFFPDTYTYAPLGMDQNKKLPSKSRMSLGAFATIYMSLNAANQIFLGLQSASQYGPVQAAFGDGYVSFEDLNEEVEDASEVIGTQYTVRQQTASWDEYSEAGDSASDNDIEERLEALTGAFQICIGQSGMEYIQSAQEGNLDVFTFFRGDSNLSTLGFSYAGDGIYTIEDTKGENNKSASSNNAEGCQFILNWLAEVVLEYIVPESLLRSILGGAREVEFNPVFEIDFDNSDIRELFKINVSSAIQLGLAEEESGRVWAGLCTRLGEIFADYTQAQVEAAIPTLRDLKLYKDDEGFQEMYGEMTSFFDLLFDISYIEERPIEIYVAGLSRDLLDNKIHVRFKPLFRKGLET